MDPSSRKKNESRIENDLLPSLKLTWPLKIGLPNRKVVFQPSVFRCYVSFRGCKTLHVFLTICAPTNSVMQLFREVDTQNTVRTAQKRPVQPHFKLLIQQVGAFLNFRCPICNKRSVEKPNHHIETLKRFPETSSLGSIKKTYNTHQTKINGDCGQM